LLSIAAFSDCRYVVDTNGEGSETYASIWGGFVNEYYSTRRSLYRLLGRWVQQNPEAATHSALSTYKHLLERSRQNQKNTLSQVEEEIIVEKDSNGISTLSQLREKWLASQQIEIEIGGRKQKVSLNEVNALRGSDDRETRRIASESFFGCFAKSKLIQATVLRAICADHVNMTRRREWSSYMTQSLMDNDLDEETIRTLLRTLEDESPSLQKYIRTKAEHFGFKRLPRYDMLAPWNEKSYWNADWTAVKTTIIQAYASFDDEIGKHVRGLFTDRRVDSKPGPGRLGTGGFCSGVYEKQTSFVFLTYNGMLNNGYTLAHELGHSVHYYFMQKSQPFLNTDAPTCLAEIGSIFGELLFTEQLLNECDTAELRAEVLENVVGRFYGMSFNMGASALFEIGLYEAIMSGDMLDAEKICEIWRAARERMYGDSVEWTPNLDYEWARLSTLFRPNFRFYNYSYSFAQLIVFALYEDYKQNTSDFTERYKQLLSRGGSMSPKDQIAEMGHDITKPAVWKLGIRRAEHFLAELQEQS
jgi:oligoendopeptidase F